MATMTPWGASQAKDVVCRGVSFHSTAGHGGYLVSKGYAKKNLSLAAQKRGLPYGGYLCYEEDCLASIIDLEIPQARKTSSNPDKLTDEYLIKAITYYNADYLIERGIEPDPEAFERFKEFNKKFSNTEVSA